MNKFDLSYTNYQGGSWSLNSPARRSCKWLCDKTDLDMVFGLNRKQYSLIDNQLIDGDLNDARKRANMSKATAYATLQIYNGVGWFIVTYRSIKTNWIGNTFKPETLLHIVIDDKFLAVEFGLCTPWIK
jgi:hypothetical protein